MKRNGLSTIIAGIVRHYIKEDWVLEMDNPSYSGVDGMHFLSRGREHAAIGIHCPEFKEVFKEVAEDGHSANLRGLGSHILFEYRVVRGSFDWVEPGSVISERVFFKINDDWYADDVREAGMTMGKRRERWMICDRAYSLLSFHPTEAFLSKYIRQRRGWKTVRPADIIIEKRDGAYWTRKDSGSHDFFTILLLLERWSGCRRGTGRPVALS